MVMQALLIYKEILTPEGDRQEFHVETLTPEVDGQEFHVEMLTPEGRLVRILCGIFTPEVECQSR